MDHETYNCTRCLEVPCVTSSIEWPPDNDASLALSSIVPVVDFADNLIFVAILRSCIHNSHHAFDSLSVRRAKLDFCGSLY